MVTKLTCGVSNFTNIFHIADIHIRLTKRHDEYQEVFERLYSAIDKTPSTTAICVLGDVFHNKSDLSPECVEIASRFLKNLADRRPTVLVAGNHDATLTNKNRLDSLSPIVNAIKHDNLFYLKDTGVYILGDILFNNFSVFDEYTPEKYIKFSDISKKYIRETNYTVGLFHGPINSAVTDIGYEITSATKNEIFDGHQMVLLGDIHKYQVLQNYDEDEKKPVVLYAGSLIQQNHGETLRGHGFVYWDLKSLKYKHVEVNNDYGYYTVDIKDGVITSSIDDIPKKTRLRVRLWNTVGSEVKNVLKDVKSTCELLEVNYLRMDGIVAGSYNYNNSKEVNIHGLNDIQYQHKLIADYVREKNPSIDDATIDMLKDINNDVNSQIVKDLTPRNLRWKPIKFEFDNMFSYGEGNVIDFTKMNGTVGLFAANASGKSSILSALSFCIFDKCDRAYKAVHVMNSQKLSFRCKFQFEINGINYFIERIGNADKKGSVKVDVKFWKVDNGNSIELNGEARRNTNDLIRDYVGTYDDFILTVLSIQNNKSGGSFIDMGQSERKDLLSQFMGLTVFDKLHDIANNQLKESSVLLRNYAKTDYEAEVNQLNTQIDNAQSVIVIHDQKIKELTNNRDLENEKLLEETTKLVKVNVVDVDVTTLERNRITFQNNIASTKTDISNDEVLLKSLDEQRVPLFEKVEKFKSDDIENKYVEYNKLTLEMSSAENSVNKQKLIITNKMEKLTKLEEHQYDPDCEYCVNNVFVKDAIRTKEEIKTDMDTAKTLLGKYTELKNKVSVISSIAQSYSEYKKLNNELSTLDLKISKIKDAQTKRENSILKDTASITQLDVRIKEYYTSKDAIEQNKTIQVVIDGIKQTIKNLEFEIKQENSNLSNINSKINNWTFEKSKIETKIKEIKQLERANQLYTFYTDAVSRDGLQYKLISQTLPDIENQVNNILSEIVDFTVSFQTDGKNVVTYIVYEDKKWPLELASGLERFVSSLAIRVALITISNLPRPNFLAIDEGFGCADADHLSAMSTLFSYLKNHFDFVWVISHLDALKDMVDNRVEIVKDNGFSRINF